MYTCGEKRHEERLNWHNIKDEFNCSQGQRQIGSTVARNSNDPSITWWGPGEGGQQWEWMEGILHKMTYWSLETGCFQICNVFLFCLVVTKRFCLLALGQMLRNQQRNTPFLKKSLSRYNWQIKCKILKVCIIEKHSLKAITYEWTIAPATFKINHSALQIFLLRWYLSFLRWAILRYHFL